MDKMRLFLLCAALTSVAAQERHYSMIGGEITLKLNPQTTEITRVVWKHGGNLVADVTAKKFTAYGPFKNRTAIAADGSLTIRNLLPEHKGSYKAEVNNRIQDHEYVVLPINGVPRPTVRLTPLTCSDKSVSCVLVCEVNTTGAEPVSYGWLIGPELSGDTGSSLAIEYIAKDPPPTYACRVSNPVSEKTSEALKNPLIPPPVPVAGVVAGVIVSLLVIALGIGLVIWKKDAIKTCFSQGETNGQPRTPNSGPAAEPRPKPSENQPLQPKNETPPSDADADMKTSAS